MTKCDHKINVEGNQYIFKNEIKYQNASHILKGQHCLMSLVSVYVQVY